MSAVGGFYANWNNARQTFGQGSPQSGADFDNSSQLTGLGTGLSSAAPGSKWSGAAASNYDKANTDHQAVFTQLAQLDQKIAQQVDNSAQVVATGRQNLNSVKRWVTDAVNSLPPGKQRHQMELQIAKAGLGRLTEVVEQTNKQSNTIGQNIGAITSEYDSLKETIRFAGDIKEDKGDGEAEALGNEDEKKEEGEFQERAKQDVQDALSGDAQAAGRVDAVLDSIWPGQPLSPEQGSYLSQMQAQQHGMSVDRLREVEQRLGDHKDIIGDSWQLVSDPDVTFPKTETEVGALDDPSVPVKGGFDQLPKDVRDTLEAPGSAGAPRLEQIAAIVKDGDDRFQTSTEIDRGLLRKTADIMESPGWQQSAEEATLPDDRRPQVLDPLVSNVFDAVAPDHQAIHSAIAGGSSGIEGVDPDEFMEGITHRAWIDNGEAAGNLFEWTASTTGPDGQIAAETAQKYATYLANHGPELLNLPGNQQIGELNPELVKSFATGLQPYQLAMVGEGVEPHGFQPLEDLGSDMQVTKQLFSVIDSNEDAAREFNKAAYSHVLGLQHSFGDLAAENPDLRTTDSRLDDLSSSARLLGAINGGQHLELASSIQNGRMNAEQAFSAAEASYNWKKEIIDQVASYAPGGDLITGQADNILLGPPPERTDFKIDPQAGYVTDIGLSATQQDAQHSATNVQYEVASRFADPNSGYIDPRFFDERTGALKPPNTISPADWSAYDTQLANYLATTHPELNASVTNYRTTYLMLHGLPSIPQIQPGG
ncbi:hypothetical protein E4P42_08815 [Mycobacterium sp. PS03-16]|uniref:TPR repeat region-containing protein n=1 Tax=Mycobacterium sp. PS03-16 TaxID=2559611 RepID=UPI0010732345|nr:EspA/EspE family type VII secretion system effector [Mycobacterium sp. PS03-16]TFV59493.1 hypothetical protein E4P42_08815 [Mycobacterium sp. PS03-16]